MNEQVKLKDEIRRAVESLGLALSGDVLLERPKREEHGDWTTNVALTLAAGAGMSARALAERIREAVDLKAAGALRLEVAGPGFLNAYLDPSQVLEVLQQIVSEGGEYGRAHRTRPEKTTVEFVSANPTGPLHVGHGRQAALGDAISTLLEWSGERVQREYYYNDSGVQIENLVASVQARLRELDGEPLLLPENGYRGEYVREIALAYREGFPEDPRGENVESVRVVAVQQMRDEQERDLNAFGVHFDIYFLESSLHDRGRVTEVVQRLEEQELRLEGEEGEVRLPATYRTVRRRVEGEVDEEGKPLYRDLPLPEGSDEPSTLWLRTTAFGDDKDRVMVKPNGQTTYFVPDVAYHLVKWRRGATRAINVQGADHHGTIQRVRAGLQALDLGIPEGYPEYVLHQMVTVMRGGEEVKVSKRAGSYVTLRELLDEVGADAVRLFFLLRKRDSQLVFDVDLARSQSEENPVYYLQMAHARLSGIFRKGAVDPKSITGEGVDLSQLSSPDELRLARMLATFPETVAGAARDLEPQRLAAYSLELARQVHGWYHKHPVLQEAYALRKARLLLARAAQQVLALSCQILGIEAPARMAFREEPGEEEVESPLPLPPSEEEKGDGPMVAAEKRAPRGR